MLEGRYCDQRFPVRKAIAVSRPFGPDVTGDLSVSGVVRTIAADTPAVLPAPDPVNMCAVLLLVLLWLPKSIRRYRPDQKIRATAQPAEYRFGRVTRHRSGTRR